METKNELKIVLRELQDKNTWLSLLEKINFNRQGLDEFATSLNTIEEETKSVSNEADDDIQSMS